MFHTMPFQRFLGGALIAAGLSVTLSGTALAQAQDCPDWSLGGVPVSTTSEAAWTAQSFQIYAGGSVNLGACAQLSAGGHVTRAPTFTLQYDDMAMGRDLDFRIESQCDTVLLINDQTGAWHFNDDEDGTLNARLRLAAAASGQYDVWVGTFSGSACQATLVVETFPGAGGGSTGGSATCPDWSLGGAEVQLAAGASETRSVVAGGSIDLFQNAAGCAIEGHGHVAQAPDFSVYFDPGNSGAPLSMAVQGSCDTLLLVNDASATWTFNDDAVDLNPAIEIAAAPAGRYDVWVGTFGAATCDASITFSAGGGGGGATGK